MLHPNRSEEKRHVKVEKDFIRKKVTERDIEKWEVAQLDFDIEPRSKPSEVFERLEEKRKIRHENLLQQLARDLYEVNQKTEKNIKISSVELKAHCKDFNNTLSEILNNINKPEVASCCGSVFIQLQNQVNVFKTKQQRLVDELHEDLMKFENDRAKENEKILRLACEQIRKIGYFLPYEVQTFVEHETLKMNKLSLNNRRCYEDLRLTLTLVTEQTFKSFMDKVYCIRESWIRQRAQENYYNLPSIVEKKICKVIPEDYIRYEVIGKELKLQLAPDKAYQTCNAVEWMENVEQALKILNSHSENLNHIYKKALSAIYNGFDKELEEISIETKQLERDLIVERVVKPILFNVSLQEVKEFDEMELHWQETLPDIQMYYSSMIDFIQDVGKLWQRHMDRICESKKLILRALEKANSDSQAVLQDLEIKLNMNLDALWQEHNVDKLEKAYEAVVAILNLLKAKYESMYLEEISAVEDFYKMSDLEADVLSAEIKELIYETHTIEHAKIVHCHSEHIRYLPEGKPIVKDIELCSYKIQAIKSQKQGIWVAFEIMSGKTKESLTEHAEHWISKKIDYLAEKKSVQLELLDKRFQRVQIEIYEKRLSQINAHEELFAKHKEKVQFLLKNLKEEFSSLLAKESAKLDYVKENLDEIEQNALLENLPGVIRGNQITLERKKEELESDLKMDFDRFRAECNTKIFDMQQENIRLMKSIKLFHESGDYSSEEGKMYVTVLEAVDKEISTELKNTVKDSSKEESDFVKKITSMFNPVVTLFGLLYEETLFNHVVQLRLRNFADDIREITKTLKLDFEFLTDQCRCLCKSLKSSRNADDDEKFWNFVIELLYRNIRHLLYPVSVPETPVQSSTGTLESQNGETDTNRCCVGKFPIQLQSKTTIIRTSEKEKTLTCKDYRSQLFNCENPPDNDGTLMAVMCNNFWEEMDFLQRAACDFYGKTQARKPIREDLIPSNYDAFANEILTKFKYYNVQIQQFWLQIILDFLPLLGRIKILANSFLESKLDDYKSAAVKSLEEFEENFAICLQSQMCDNLQELQDLDGKLLPLHGYPNNADLLSALEEEVVQKTANQEIKWEATIKKFKGQLKCFRARHILEKLEISKIEITYNKFRDTIFVEELSNVLLNEILRYCDKGGFCLKEVSTLNLPAQNEGEKEGGSLASGEVPDEHKLDIVPSIKNLHTVQTYLRQLRQIIDRERSEEVKPAVCPPCPENSDESFHGEDVCEEFCQGKLNVMLEITNFETPVGKILETLDGYIRKLKTFAKSQEKTHETELYKWLEKWKYNVKRVLKLYSVTYEEKEEKPEERHSQQSENSKPKTEKTSASVTSTFPRLCPTTEHDLKDTSCDTLKTKNQFQRNRPVSNENKEDPEVVDPSPANSQKSKLTETDGFKNTTSAFLISPRNYRGQIPVLSRHSLYFFRMSPPVTRSPSPLKKITLKEKSPNKIKTITLQDPKKKNKSQNSRSPSPAKRITGSYKKANSASSAAGQSRNSEKPATAKRADSSKQASPRVNSPTKRKSKIFSSNNVDYSVKSKSGKELQRPDGDTNSIVIKQTSHPSLYANEKIIRPQEKISLDHIKNEVFTGDHRRLSLEKVHLCIEKTVDNFNLAERKRSYLVTYSSEDLKNQEEISLSFLKNISSTDIKNFTKDKNDENESQSAIRTLSGHELILTPSMKLEIDKEESDTLEISQILQSQEENFDDKADIHILQDDENEYDSEVSTDGEMTQQRNKGQGRNCNDLQSANSLWKSREADLLNDVDYRQSVYHPAVCRRQNSDTGEMEFRMKSKSIEDNFGFPNKAGKRVVRTRSSNLNNKYASQCFTTDKLDSCSNDRSWASSFDKTDERPMYNSVIQEVPFYGMKRIRTKKERISGACLRFTLKVIRLLAIFNLWPGDNCYLLTSQSLRFAR